MKTHSDDTHPAEILYVILTGDPTETRKAKRASGASRISDRVSALAPNIIVVDVGNSTDLCPGRYGVHVVEEFLNDFRDGRCRLEDGSMGYSDDKKRTVHSLIHIGNDTPEILDRVKRTLPNQAVNLSQVPSSGEASVLIKKIAPERARAANLLSGINSVMADHIQAVWEECFAPCSGPKRFNGTALSPSAADEVVASAGERTSKAALYVRAGLQKILPANSRIRAALRL